MASLPPHLDDLVQVHELNRLFLHLLWGRAAAGRDCLGLPPGALRILKRAAPAALDKSAEFPRALFNLRLPEAVPGDWFADQEASHARARHTLQLTILLCIWNCCRQSTYTARAFFGLSLDSVRRLRATPLSDLPAFALGGDLLYCAFSDSEWLWQGLLGEASREHREWLALVALQPRLDASGPRRSIQ